MRGLERVGDPQRNRQRVGERYGAARDTDGQLVAVDELQDEGTPTTRIRERLELLDGREYIAGFPSPLLPPSTVRSP